MYKRIDLTQLEGLSTYQDTLAFLQQAYSDSIDAIAQAIGDNVIVAGVDDEGANWGDGWVIIAGELMPFVGGVKADQILTEELTDTEVFGDDSVKTVYYTKRAVLGSTGGIDFTDFVRLTQLKTTDANLQALTTLVNSLPVTLTGEMKIWPKTIAPAGYLLCDGSAVSRTTYAALFAVIGTSFGAGNGTTTFNLPSMGGKFVAGYTSGDVDYNAIGKTGGEKKHTLNVNELPAHDHTTHGQGVIGGAGGPYYLSNNNGAYSGSGSDGFGRSNAPDTDMKTGQTGGGLSHENRPPFISLQYIIKT